LVLRVVELPDWESKRIAIRDYLNAQGVDAGSSAQVVLTDGRAVEGLYPRLATDVGPGATDPQLFVLDVPGAPELATIRLDGVDSIDLTFKSRKLTKQFKR
jgi:hypothetical protein